MKNENLLPKFRELPDEKLHILTTTMTSVCFLLKPTCKDCKDRNTVVCPPAVALTVIQERDVDKFFFYHSTLFTSGV